jgi:virulence factor Mce-like protein
MVAMVFFTASCVGLLIYLWVSFGGTLPLAPAGYRFSVDFNQAVELAPQSEVEIAGVQVGQVVSVSLDRRRGLERAVLEIDRQFAPRPADTRAILRAKTLLGETFVELSAGSPSGPKLRDGGTLPQGQVAPTVQLDQILSAFDPATREAFETWMQQGGIALTGRGEQFNAALAQLYPFATNVESVLTVLRRESAATSTLLNDGGQVFSALAASPPALQGFVTHSNALFAATAARDADLASTIRAFPGFLNQTRATIDRVASFSRTAKPLIDELRPAAVALNPDLTKLVAVAPELRTFLTDIGPLDSASRAGLPAVQSFLTDSVPFLVRAKPYLGDLIPSIDYINTYRREIAGFFASSTASTEGQAASAYGKLLHYLRISTPINPEALMPDQHRPSTDRANPYLDPGGYHLLSAGLPVFSGYLCTRNALPELSPSLSDMTTEVAGNTLTMAQLVQQYYYTSDPSGPACVAEHPLGSAAIGQKADFPQLQPLP